MKRRPLDPSVDTTRRQEGVHVVHGSVVRCCEQGEAMCPCTCHEPPLNLRTPEPPPEAA
jgi:hypothetical protein